jgi:hypothetical protein
VLAEGSFPNLISRRSRNGRSVLGQRTALFLFPISSCLTWLRRTDRTRDIIPKDHGAICDNKAVQKAKICLFAGIYGLANSEGTGCLGGHNSGAYRRGGTIRPYAAMTGYGSKCMGTPPQLVHGWSPCCRRPRRRQPGHRKCNTWFSLGPAICQTGRKDLIAACIRGHNWTA